MFEIDQKKIEMMSLRPEENDKLIIPSYGINHDYATINDSRKGRFNEIPFYLMIEGYRESSFKLLNDLLNDDKTSWSDIDSKIFPILFLFRHYLELIIKENTRLSKIKEKEITSNDIGYKDSHSLSELWECLKPYIVKEFGENIEEKSIENLINEIEEIDKGSYSFRYPYDKARKGNTSIIFHIEENKTIDLINLGTKMQKMANYFGGINDCLYARLDEI